LSCIATHQAISPLDVKKLAGRIIFKYFTNMRKAGYFKSFKPAHLLLWLLLFVAWYYMRVNDFPTKSVALMVTAVKVIVLAILVYFTNYFLIPRLLYTRRYLLFGGIFLSMIFIAGMFKIFVIITLLQPYYRQRLGLFDDMQTKIYDDLLPLFLLVSTGAAVKLVTSYIVSERRIAEISKEKAETELQFLKSQVNPHFVFNTLNAIYFQIDKTNHEARETLIQFSDLLRYQLYECNADKIAIERELAYLKDYVRLQMKRKDEQYKVAWEDGVGMHGFSIAPLLLMPLAENAFKHISHYADQPNRIVIETAFREGIFSFKISNTTEPGDRSREPSVGGIGLNNVRRRLELLYPGRHKLEIENPDGLFSITLSLQLHEN
jgi:two-component system, LytTR family, sensor kinase